MKKSISLVLLLSCLSLPFLAHAEIYKCTTNGRTVFSDTPCGDSAKVVDVSAAKQKTGARFSNEEIDSLGSEMRTERRKGELERDIARTQKKLDQILDNYHLNKAKLERELAEHKQKKYYQNWQHHKYKRDHYYEKKQELKNQIKANHREYKADREKVYNKLAKLRRERNDIR